MPRKSPARKGQVRRNVREMERKRLKVKQVPKPPNKKQIPVLNYISFPDAFSALTFCKTSSTFFFTQSCLLIALLVVPYVLLNLTLAATGK